MLKTYSDKRKSAKMYFGMNVTVIYIGYNGVAGVYIMSLSNSLIECNFMALKHYLCNNMKQPRLFVRTINSCNK